MQRTQHNPKLRRRNLAVLVVVVITMLALFAVGLSLIILK